ncbi:MAG: SMP-30/gluconolactonase/LRE family protein [Ferruginibacter sp.]
MNKVFATFLGLCFGLVCFAQETRELAVYRPMSVVDLRKSASANLVNAQWLVREASIKPVSFNAPGPSKTDPLLLYPTGQKINTHNIYPNISDAAFNDNNWKKVNDLEERQGSGKLSFVWYKTSVIVPEKIDGNAVTGTKIYFEITADDYSEVYINGEQNKQFGQTGAGVISGFNSRNRLVLTGNARPGEKFEIAVLVINGTIGNEPDNYVWIRNAVLDVYKPELFSNEKIGKIYKIENSFDNIISPNTSVEKLADGFSFTEGPVWHPDGFLLFSDPNMNVIYRYNPLNKNVTIYQSHSGYTGTDIGTLGQPGSNGLAIDAEGRLIACQHGNRQLIRHELKGPVTILADKVDGKRLNSPNDVVIKSDGTVYLTDPPYGLADNYKDVKKELDYAGVVMIKNGKVTTVAKDCGGPNGIAFSPNEKYMYVSNWDIRDIHHTKDIWRYEVQEDGTLKNGKVFYSFNYTLDDEALDGLKVDNAGNIFSSAPGGLYVIDSNANLLGKIECPERPANMAWGDADGKTLYLTAHSGLYKIRTLTGGKIAVKK